MVLQRSRLASLIAYSIYWVFHTNTRFNLRKTNAANEEPIGRLDNGRISLGISARPIASSFYQLEQRDGRSPDWMPGRSTKYIVVGLFFVFCICCFSAVILVFLIVILYNSCNNR